MSYSVKSTMAEWKWVTLWLGIVGVRLVFMMAPFDIYFTSPLVRGEPRPPDFPEGPVRAEPPARRLVLFIADGFRLRSFLGTDRAPHLRSTAENRGSWAVSHTRIPTESRPGHVAIIAGIYEDPSAIAKGWKENPVEFDSFFNRSRRTWSWGSPDILPMFAKGARGGNVLADSYGHEMEDFSGESSTSRVDNWVFRKVETLFRDAHTRPGLADSLRGDRIVLFLHLLGLDTAGHVHKPHSSQYQDNIRTVDDGIKRIENIIEEFYGRDNKTAYVFTADHGMTDWGSHGAGSDDETETPFIAWGAGFRHTKDTVSNRNSHIMQADICPLMSSLIGTKIPYDSVGSIPDRFVDTSDENIAIILYDNMKQILTQYNHKREIVEANAVKFLFRPFQALTQNKILDSIASVERLLQQKNYEKAKIKCKETIKTALDGLEYYQNYYQNILLTSLTISYIGSMVWMLSILLEHFQINQKIESVHNKKASVHTKRLNVIFGLILFIVLYFLIVQKLPFTYYCYFVLPVILWWRVFHFRERWQIFFKKLLHQMSPFHLIIKSTCLIVLYFSGIIILITTFFHRWALSFGLLGLAVFPLWEKNRKNLTLRIIFVWILSCASLAVFSLLPVVGKEENKHIVGSSGALWFVLSMIYLFPHSTKMLRSGQETKLENLIIVIPPLLMIMALQNKYLTSYQFEKKLGVWSITQIFCWIISGLCFIVPMLSSDLILSRLFCIKASFAVFFLLLSVNHEGFFLLALSINLFCWLIIEHKTYKRDEDIELLKLSFKTIHDDSLKTGINDVQRPINLGDFRRSFIFLLYIILSFFGTGNTASINSFDPSWVRCFVSQFSPFIMAALIISKTLVPFLIVVCTLNAVNIVVKTPRMHLFLVMLVFSDVMGIVFLHMVTNKGSWLEIGSSLSHYIIMESIVFFVIILYGMGKVMTTTNLLPQKNIQNKKERLKKI